MPKCRCIVAISGSFVFLLRVTSSHELARSSYGIPCELVINTCRNLEILVRIPLSCHKLARSSYGIPCELVTHAGILRSRETSASDQMYASTSRIPYRLKLEINPEVSPVIAPQHQSASPMAYSTGGLFDFGHLLPYRKRTTTCPTYPSDAPSQPRHSTYTTAKTSLRADAPPRPRLPIHLLRDPVIPWPDL